jgi:hypothetical protein
MPARIISAAALVAMLIAGVVVAGLCHTPRAALPDTDHLGPDPGASVAGYLTHARDTVTTRDDRPRWALASFTTEPTPAQAADLASEVRVAQVIYRVPLNRVQTPITVVDVPAGRAALLDSAAVAASHVLLDAPVDDPRGRVVADVASQRLRADCGCVVGLVVRGTPELLRALAARPGVRVVEALPPDAVAGHFGVTPLLPSQTDHVVPGPDDGPVP